MMEDAIMRMIEAGLAMKKADDDRRAAALEKERQANLDSWEEMTRAVRALLPDPLGKHLNAVGASEGRQRGRSEYFELAIEGLAPIRLIAQMYGKAEILDYCLPSLVHTMEDSRPYFSFKYKQKVGGAIEYIFAQAKTMHDDYVLAMAEWASDHGHAGEKVVVDPVYEDIGGEEVSINLTAAWEFVRKQG
jgi:hypothetical protein